MSHGAGTHESTTGIQRLCLRISPAAITMLRLSSTTGIQRLCLRISPAAITMLRLSWSVIEYSAKYEAAGELTHVKDIIKWGTDYFLKTFNHTADTIDRVVSQVGKGDTTGGATDPNDHYSWMRPEDIDYVWPVLTCSSCSDLASEMAAALASALIKALFCLFMLKLI